MHGGVRPWWQHGSSDTYRVASARSLAAGGADRLDLGVRRAERAVKALADDLVAVAPITAPTSGLGLTRPRPLLGQLDRAGQVAAVGIGR